MNAAKSRDINGIVLLDKASGISSNRALQQVKHLFFAKKAGHTGSLDPLASGILPICLGQATKIAHYLLNDNKGYFVRGKLGQTTDTLDSDGKILATKAIDNITSAQIQQTLLNFVGEYEQIPPMYSALKKDGQPLYKLARSGIYVERKARAVRIFKINFISYKKGILTLDVRCSKGTYIRTLIDDIGSHLDCGAHLVELRRTNFAKLDITEALKFDELQKLQQKSSQALDDILLKSEDLLPNFDAVYLDKNQSKLIKYGQKIDFIGLNGNSPKLLKLFDEKHQFFGIGLATENKLKAKRLFV